MATAAAPRRFCRCACFCTENLYVARYRLHVRFRGEEQLRRDYGPILHSRGCVSPKDFQQLLGEVELRSHRGHPASSLRLPLPLVPGLLLLFYHPLPHLGGGNGKLPSLSRRCSGGSSWRRSRLPGKPSFQAPTTPRGRTSTTHCRMKLWPLSFWPQLSTAHRRGQTSKAFSSGWRQCLVLLHELGLDEPLVTPLRERFLQPLTALLYPDCGGGSWLDSHRAFVVKYAPGQDRELGCHYDNAELTLNVALGKTFTGGALYFGNLFQAPSALARPLDVEHVVGQGILHRGGQLHGARPLGTGERWNLVIWLRASAVRNRLCPMCCRKPELVDDDGFGDGFTREEPATVDVCALT
ncbi:2-oxoglutarate and iron-dependent oxygenase domain-containing protein 2 isoform X2 [Suricata suricatta]|uniref:2-oxoglutarate and iron-dependent oxygenase domain-containing protein 2 isoform X2 n=1 Tax=Suricata suricatta TaxID=37032 RepID=UPI0011563CF4|nr:2-oxoglutarate and iron-dependent oxygenase domain-containing protein 2 isoform X2 [Suricata suricatta]